MCRRRGPSQSRSAAFPRGGPTWFAADRLWRTATVSTRRGDWWIQARASGVISRQFRLLFAGQAVSVVGDALFPVALAFAVLDEPDGTPVQLGIVLAAQTVP